MTGMDFITYTTPEPTFTTVTETESVEHPTYYGGPDDPYEAIKVIEAWGMGFNLGNALKYICRAGKKDPAKVVEDLKKAAFYLDREIGNRAKELQ
jgi:hypothetical protein